MPYIQTVRGPVDPSDLGVCYGHEHLIGAPPPDVSADPDFVLDDEDAAVEEMRRFRAAGGSAVVEMSTADYGRDAAALRRIAERSGVHVVCATGYNKDPFSLRVIGEAGVEELAGRFVGEITNGIEGTDVRAGLVKASSTLDRISEPAERVFRAAAAAHRRTGAPISTHTEAGTMAPDQVRLLESEGVDPRRVVVGHMDRKLDASYHLEVAGTGAFLGYDQISKTKYYPDAERAEMIARLVESGYGKQILLGGDLARRSYWPAYGRPDAPGFDYILSRFVPLLRTVGLSEEAVDDLLIHNPARAFAFDDGRSEPGRARADQGRRTRSEPGRTPHLGQERDADPRDERRDHPKRS